MSARLWWAAAAVWFAGVAVAGAWLFADRAQDRQQRAREAAWLERVRAVQAVQPNGAAAVDDPIMAAAGPAEESPMQRRSPPPRTTVEPDRLMAHVRALAFPRFAEARRKKARGIIAHALTEMGYTPDLQGYKTGMNVIAERPGRDPAAKAVLVAAHFDTVPGTPGADDNASAVAVALEVARQLKDRPTRRPLRIVFFDEEEVGMVGSSAYALSPTRRAGLSAVVVLEMVGFTCKTKGCQRFPPGLPPGLAPDVGDFIAVVGDLEHVELLEAFRRAGGPDRPPIFALPVPDKGDPLPDTRRSDHAPFWDAGIGAVMVTDTADLRNPHYHQPSDTPETLDPQFMAGVAAMTIDAVIELLERDGP